MVKCVVAILVVPVLVFSCGGDSPTNLADQPLLLTGTLAYQQVVNLDFTLDDADIIRIEVVDLSPILVDITTNPNFIPTIGFGLGSPVEGSCLTRQRLSAQQGGFFTFGLDAGDYCIQLSDTGFLPEDAVVRYTLSITSFS
jgi:hypothetical protein